MSVDRKLKPAPRRPEWLLRGLVVLVILAVAWFYLWTVKTASARLDLTGQKNDYYNLLVDGFLDGHLYMKADPDPQLLALAPAQRPGNAPFKLDASLYRDRYYLYFGVAPVVLLYVPYALLTGHDLPEAGAAVLFLVAALVLATAWWWEVRRRFFPSLHGFWFILGVVALGLCTAAPSTLRRPLFYEVAIGAGYAFSMTALWALSRAAWQSGRSRWWWLVLGGVAVGLAIGSRANLGPAGLLVLGLAAVLLARQARAGLRARTFALALLATGAGAGVIGAGLAGYNFARFGRITEFGHTYQIGLVPKQLFRVENFAHNLRLYYLLPPVLNGYFPFVSPGNEGPKPDDYIGREETHGEWPWTLVVGLAVVSAIALGEQRGPAPGRRWARVIVLPLALFAVNFVVVALTGVRANRYMLDFHPALVLATLVVLGAALAERRRWTWGVAVGAAVLIPAAALFNVVGSLQVHGFFRSTAPASYAAIADRSDRLVWPLLGSEAAAVGDREVALTWATGNRGRKREPILTAGSQDFRDSLFVDYDGLGRVRFVYAHGVEGQVEGAWFDYTPGKTVSVLISGALLLPGETHPWFDRYAPEERRALKRRLRVSVDRELRFNRDVVSYDSSPRLQRWGEWLRADGKFLVFTGLLEAMSVRPLADAWVRSRAAEGGSIALKLELPVDRFGTTEPLLQQRGPKGFDSLAIEYLRPGFVRLLHDQQGGGGRWSDEFAVDYRRPQSVEIDLPVASNDLIWSAVEGNGNGAIQGLMRVRWNGREVFRPSLPVLPAALLDVTLGANTYNASGLNAFFAGQLQESRRLSPLSDLRPGTLVGRLGEDRVLSDQRGIWLRLAQTDGTVAALVWNRDGTTGRVSLGWVEGGRCGWLAQLDLEQTAGLNVTVRSPDRPGANGIGNGWIEVETKDGAHYALKSDFLLKGVQWAWGQSPHDWSGSALGRPTGWQEPSADRLPGRLELRFKLPAGGIVGGDPLLSAGPAGKADSVYLKGLGNNRYVLGVDHWGYGAVESKPVELAAEQVHWLVIELGSLGHDLPADRARLVVNGAVVLDAAQALYAVRPEEVVYGENPHGMSTSSATFRGGIIAVRSELK